jgi:hypothetical protein
MSKESAIPKQLPAWKIWANPIVRRYARSRLRPVGLGVWLLLTILIAGFLFFVSWATANSWNQSSAVDAARAPLIPLLFFQGILLFGLATGQVAGAMTAEADEGVLDYQRLAPMTPLAKVLGYLFGLPIREWVLFFATMPFTLWSLWRGEVPFHIAAQLYGVILVAGVLYHLTGLLAGTVMKNRRWAFLSSMGLVFALYTVIPQAAKFGLVYFKYLTITPVFEESLRYLTSRNIGAAIETVQAMLPSAKFFGLSFPQYVFTLLSQGVLILVMVTMLWRRWRRKESHLLGKLGAVGLFGWIQLVFIGNALPLIDTGELFPSHAFRQRFGRFNSDWGEPSTGDAMMMIGVYGVVTLLILFWMSLLITPDDEGQVRGWRRARKLGKTKLSPLSDPATGVPWLVLMVAMGAYGWSSFAGMVVDSRWFPQYDLSALSVVTFSLVLLVGGLGFQALLEWKGKRVTGLVVILGGVLPLMLGTILAVSGLVVVATWIIGICPLAWPVSASTLLIPVEDLDLSEGKMRGLIRAAPPSFWFWQGVGALVLGWLMSGLWKSRRAIAEKTKGGTSVVEELSLK